MEPRSECGNQRLEGSGGKRANFIVSFLFLHSMVRVLGIHIKVSDYYTDSVVK
jgi:hypothetical protein